MQQQELFLQRLCLAANLQGTVYVRGNIKRRGHNQVQEMVVLHTSWATPQILFLLSLLWSPVLCRLPAALGGCHLTDTSLEL